MIHLDYSKYKCKYVADFETSTEKWNVSKARVWLYDLCTIDNDLKHLTGTSLNEFMHTLIKVVSIKRKNILVAFHNLAYDGTYIISWLLENGFTATENTEPKQGEFYCIINTMGQHFGYCINICGNHIAFVDSYKTIHLSVKDIAEAYQLPILKGEIDYDLYREENYTPTENEIAYIHNDTEIVARALLHNFSMGLHKVTQPANALNYYVKTIGGKDTFNSLFPTDYDLSFAREAYFGGMCYANPRYLNLEINNLKSYDINSMYPAAMLHAPLPFGYPEKVKGNVIESDEYKRRLKIGKPIIYIQKIRCAYDLKPNKIPSLFKNRFYTNELHSTSSQNRILELTLTNFDLEMLFENYFVYQIEYVEGEIYSCQQGYNLTDEEFNNLSYEEIVEKDGKGSLFYDYIKFWRQVKENSKGAKRTNAKFMQNMLYGNFGKNIDGNIKVPYLDDGLVKYKTKNNNQCRQEYVPMAVFITSYCRYLLIKDILKNINNFVYCDTDSLYLIDTGIEPSLRVHNYIYGAYKIEHIIKRIKVVGSKRYIYEGSNPDGTKYGLYVKCCGADNNIKKQITFENFSLGLIIEGKKQVKTVVGGKHITTTQYSIK